MLSECILAIGLSTVSADVEVGDKLVTLTAATVMSGTEKLAEVQPGMELAATEVREPWVKANVTGDGKQVEGWIWERNLIVQPAIAFLKLTVRVQSEARSADHYFNWLDGNGDDALSRSEFLSGTRNQTLSDFNTQLHDLERALKPNLEMVRRSGRDPNEHFQRWVWMVIHIPSIGENLKRRQMPFVSWKRPSKLPETTGQAETFGAARLPRACWTVKTRTREHKEPKRYSHGRMSTATTGSLWKSSCMQ